MYDVAEVIDESDALASDAVEYDQLFRVLTDETRCRAIAYLSTVEGPVSRVELVHHVADSVSASDDRDELRRLDIRFYHVHLPKMERAGLLTHDREKEVVEPSPAINAAASLVEDLSESR